MKKTLFGLFLCALSVLPFGMEKVSAAPQFDNGVKVEQARWYGRGYYGGWGYGGGYGYGGWGSSYGYGYGYPYSYGYGCGDCGGCGYGSGCGGCCGGGLFGWWF